MRFRVHWQQEHDGRVLVQAVGDIDMAAGGALCGALTAAPRTGPPAVTIDLTEVSFLDCASVRALLHAHQVADAQGIALTVQNPAPMVECVLRIVEVAEPLGLPPAAERDGRRFHGSG